MNLLTTSPSPNRGKGKNLKIYMICSPLLFRRGVGGEETISFTA